MKSLLLNKMAVGLVFLALMVSFTGCDKAEEAIQSTDLGASAGITKLMAKATEAIGGVTDIESAKAALPALKDVDLDLGKLVAKFGEMSPDQKSKLSGVVSKAMPALENAMNKVTSLSGVGDIVGPTLASLKGKLAGLM